MAKGDLRAMREARVARAAVKAARPKARVVPDELGWYLEVRNDGIIGTRRDMARLYRAAADVEEAMDRVMFCGAVYVRPFDQAVRVKLMGDETDGMRRSVARALEEIAVAINAGGQR